MKNPARVYLPYNRNVVVSVILDSSYLHRITFTSPDGTTRVVEAAAEGGVVAETFVLATGVDPNPYGFPVDVKIEHSPNGGRTFLLSTVKKACCRTIPVVSTILYSDDSFGDGDFDDAVVVFTWVRQDF